MLRNLQMVMHIDQAEGQLDQKRVDLQLTILLQSGQAVRQPQREHILQNRIGQRRADLIGPALEASHQVEVIHQVEQTEIVTAQVEVALLAVEVIHPAAEVHRVEVVQVEAEVAVHRAEVIHQVGVHQEVVHLLAEAALQEVVLHQAEVLPQVEAVVPDHQEALEEETR
jgi:hypothetical protein